MGASQLNQSRFEYLFWVSFLFKIWTVMWDNILLLIRCKDLRSCVSY
jgi:hypothetical protein